MLGNLLKSSSSGGYRHSSLSDEYECSLDLPETETATPATCNRFSDIYTWGSGLHGELGHPQLQPQRYVSDPQCVTELQGNSIVDLACGDRRTIVLDQEGNVFYWGRKFGKSIDENQRFKPKMFLWTDISISPIKMNFEKKIDETVTKYDGKFNK
jgi:alpha-tubulin suppressor-like RCC1 family protein